MTELKDFEMLLLGRSGNKRCRDHHGAQADSYLGWKVLESQLQHWLPFLGI